MLTFACARVPAAPRFAARAGAIFAFSLLACVMSHAPARAQEVWSSGCVGGWHGFNCVDRWAPYGDPYIRPAPPPADAEGRALARERDRRWVDRCRPVIKQDRYGVPRYHYAMPGCGFGIGEY